MARRRAPVTVVILAAGQGTRMRSKTIKLLHPVAGQPMVARLLDSVQAIRPQRIITVVGFQAEHTLGRRILERHSTVNIYGRKYQLGARVLKMNGFSAHADRDELATYVKHIPGLKSVFVVHGEEAASLAFAAYLESLGVRAHVPQPLEHVEL